MWGCQVKQENFCVSAVCPVPAEVAGHLRRDGADESFTNTAKSGQNGRIDTRGSVGTSELSKRHEELVVTPGQSSNLTLPALHVRNCSFVFFLFRFPTMPGNTWTLLRHGSIRDTLSVDSQ